MGTGQFDELVGKIKSRGYWRVILRPLKFEKERISNLDDCADLVKECKVRLRGWRYPYWKEEPLRGLDWVESRTDRAAHKEMWRMYQSGQFFHLFGCTEDWLEENIKFYGPPRHEIPPPKTIISLSNLLHIVTEIYEFASRLAQKSIFDTGLYLLIELHGMRKRKLYIDRKYLLSIGYMPFNGDYICQILEDLPKHTTLQAEEIIGQSKDLALQHAIWIYKRFNWRKPSLEMLKEAQNRLLGQRS